MEEQEVYNTKERDFDAVSPEHYKVGDVYEVINVIENYDLGFNLGNAIKYILRAGVKDNETYAEDLRKAIWYLDREVNNNLF